MNQRSLFILFAIVISSIIFSCSKTSLFITSPDALLLTSADTLHFDTVFTTAGSITQSFKIFNYNDRKLLISKIELAGSSSSAFKLNVDGSPGNSFTNIEIASNDSIYVFVIVNVNPTVVNTPFLIRDSIGIYYNGNERIVQLDAYGQNAHFLRNASATKDTSWNNDLPVVVLENFTITAGKTLTINKGVKVYCHSDALITVNGTLKTSGEKYDSTRIIFRGDRLEDYYKDIPGSWPGILFSESSSNNVLNYTDVKNAKEAINIKGAAANSFNLLLNECIIDNASNVGILAINSGIKAINCLISNCENNIKITAGGNYNFIHCTVVTYSNNYIFHQNPVLSISNADDNNQTFPLIASFVNSIFYGDNGVVVDEILIQQSGTGIFDLKFENILYKGNNLLSTLFENSLQNEDPAFTKIDAFNNVYDFHLLPESPCINSGKAAGVTVDLAGTPRDQNPDMGCYELQ